MTAATASINTDRSDVDARLSSYRLQPLTAWRAMRRLLKDKEDTVQVFVIMRALSGKAVPKGYRRLLATAEGGRQAYLRDEFADKLQDRDWVAQFGPGTVGAAYRDFIAPRGLSAYGLAEESRKARGGEDIDLEHPFAWYGRRMRDVHDVWHVLTGYGTDALGEACVVAFSYAQTKSLGFAFIAAMGARQFEKARTGLPYQRAVMQAWRNGRRSAWLPALDYEALFAEPLESARKRLNIATPDIYQSIPAERRDRFPEAEGQAEVAATAAAAA
ncbi:ubiquinone biosynthesis protein [Caulobacter sp. CCUG 60055]|nr:Coq4 family protein [Caulobacter sp. CCUG 60055]MBQ1541316.1 ubiquinone biosynthesis protein [Caulobacteraceae bacterium]MCI3182064.1 ubiquinone biosynthesis protein [Caulobacter sp. CCUG 60055]